MFGTAFVAGCSPVPRAYYDSATKAGNEALVKEYEEADVVLAPVARKVMVRSGNACAAPSLISILLKGLSGHKAYCNAVKQTIGSSQTCKREWRRKPAWQVK